MCAVAEMRRGCDAFPIVLKSRAIRGEFPTSRKRVIKVHILTTGRAFVRDFLAETLTLRGVCVEDFFVVVERMSRVRRERIEDCLQEHHQVQG